MYSIILVLLLAIGKAVGTFKLIGVKDFPFNEELNSNIEQYLETTNGDAFSALLSNRSVISWGNPNFGGDNSAITKQNNNIGSLYSNGYAFAATNLFSPYLTTWGDAKNGGDSSKAVITSKIMKVVSTDNAFAALDFNGNVVAWGGNKGGTNAPPGLSNVKGLYSTSTHFAAMFYDGTVVIWGLYEFDLSPSESDFFLTSKVEQVYTTNTAFAFRNNYDEVLLVGDAVIYVNVNGSLEPVKLVFDVREVVPSKEEFIVKLFDDSVLVGNLSYFQENPSLAATLSGPIFNMYATDYAFAVEDVQYNYYTFGKPEYGGNSSLVSLLNIKHFYSNRNSFAAKDEDGNLITWGKRKETNKLLELVLEFEEIQSTSSFFLAHIGNELVVWSLDERLQLLQNVRNYKLIGEAILVKVPFESNPSKESTFVVTRAPTLTPKVSAVPYAVVGSVCFALFIGSAVMFKLKRNAEKKELLELEDDKDSETTMTNREIEFLYDESLPYEEGVLFVWFRKKRKRKGKKIKKKLDEKVEREEVEQKVEEEKLDDSA